MIDLACFCLLLLSQISQFEIKSMNTEALETPVRIDDAPPKGKLLSGVALAAALGESRWTVQAMKIAGYKFAYGKKTTESHARKWRAEHPEFVAAQVYHDRDEKKRLEAKGSSRSNN